MYSNIANTYHEMLHLLTLIVRTARHCCRLWPAIVINTGNVRFHHIQIQYQSIVRMHWIARWKFDKTPYQVPNFWLHLHLSVFLPMTFACYTGPSGDILLASRKCRSSYWAGDHLLVERSPHCININCTVAQLPLLYCHSFSSVT